MKKCMQIYILGVYQALVRETYHRQVFNENNLLFDKLDCDYLKGYWKEFQKGNHT